MSRCLDRESGRLRRPYVDCSLVVPVQKTWFHLRPNHEQHSRVVPRAGCNHLSSFLGNSGQRVFCGSPRCQVGNMGILFSTYNNVRCLDNADFHCRVDHDTLWDSISIPYCQSTQFRFSSRTHFRVLLAENILCGEWQQNQRRVNYPDLNIEFLWQLVSTIGANTWTTSPRRSNRSRKRSIALRFRKLPVWRQSRIAAAVPSCERLLHCCNPENVTIQFQTLRSYESIDLQTGASYFAVSIRIVLAVADTCTRKKTGRNSAPIQRTPYVDRTMVAVCLRLER